MKVKQLTVFLENRSGRLAEVADMVGQAGINIRGFSTTEAAEYGIVRLILTDPERARELLHDAGFTTHFAEVLCVNVEDVPGGLATVLDQLRDAGVSIDYLYSISFWNICFAVRDIDRAVDLLKDKVKLLTDDGGACAVSTVAGSTARHCLDPGCGRPAGCIGSRPPRPCRASSSRRCRWSACAACSRTPTRTSPSTRRRWTSWA